MQKSQKINSMQKFVGLQYRLTHKYCPAHVEFFCNKNNWQQTTGYSFVKPN